ncbi:MAG: hypothetical protein RI958_1388 [Actinomycetota bacterium]
MLAAVTLLGACRAEQPTVDATTIDATTMAERAVDDTPSTTTRARSLGTTTQPTRSTQPTAIEPVSVSGPLEGGDGPANGLADQLEAVGYTETEWAVEGAATAYRPLGRTPGNGRWTVTPTTVAPFRTRILVRRPDAPRFSGTVIVEWLNVSAGFDSHPDWTYTADEIVRSGHAWVGVSAQAVGVGGGTDALGRPAGGGLMAASPERYGRLVHPGDAYSFDIFTQAARALEHHDGPAPLGDLRIDRIIAIGASQSAFFLSTYVNAVQPLTGQFDGFLVHSRGRPVASLDGRGNLGPTDSPTVQIRDDLDQPVMIVAAENDLTILEYAQARQPDGATVRTWEIAGTAHADEYLVRTSAGLGADVDVGALLGCTTPLNDGPHGEVLRAALRHLVVWAGGGPPPPPVPRIELASLRPAVIARDDTGIALGGVRTPHVDVPTTILTGDPAPDAAAFCVLFGQTLPIDPAVLASRYPSAGRYLELVTASLDAAVELGVILVDDAAAVLDQARSRSMMFEVTRSTAGSPKANTQSVVPTVTT